MVESAETQRKAFGTPTSAIAPGSRYKAKIDAVFPERRRDLSGYHDCFLGVSLENDQFTRPRLLGILEWISRRFPRCTVLIGDSIHRITLETAKGIPPHAALAEALHLGERFVRDERHVFDAFSEATAFSFVTCGELQATPAYGAHHARLRALFDKDEAFRASVESFGKSYHAKHSSDLSEVQRYHRIRRSSDYFLEEFAIFACLKDRGIPVMVYPGSFSTLSEIADGKHPDAPVQLRDLTVVSLHLRGR
jgi:tRNA-dependent cyclodipeptide synthase